MLEENMTMFSSLSNGELLAEAQRLATNEREATTALVRCLIEVEDRGLHLGLGCGSMFSYCTDVLRLCEHAAYNRIHVARAARTFPGVLDKLADGSLTLTAVRLIAPHLTVDNHEWMLSAAAHLKKRDIEELVASLAPQPDVPTVIQRRPALAPLAPQRYMFQMTIGQDTHDVLRQLQDLLRHSIPDADPAAIVDRALRLLLDDVLRQKCGITTRGRHTHDACSNSRDIPAAVRRAVWTRDRGRCAFVGAHGRCTARAFLEYHHIVPYASGGKATVDNIALRCRAHNAYEAQLFFGDWVRESDDDSFWNELPELRALSCQLSRTGATKTGRTACGDHAAYNSASRVQRRGTGTA
jgi:hypothetical protein